MADIPASLVKQLRDMTSAAMGACKKALEESGGDLKKAEELLRAKNIKVEQTQRSAAEGAVAMKVTPDQRAVAVVEMRCETDFAARSDNFQKLIASITDEVLKARPADAAAASKLPAVAKGLQEAGAITIRENVVLAWAEVKSVDGDGAVGCYVHHNGSVGAAVGLRAPQAATQKPAFVELARSLAMHVTAHDPSPLAVERGQIPADLVAREKAIFMKQLDEDPKEKAKPANIKEKVVEGRMRKFYEDRALLEQKFVKDPEQSITQLLEKASKELGGKVELQWFVRRHVGA